MEILPHNKLAILIDKLTELDELAKSLGIENIYGTAGISDLIASHTLKHDYVIDQHGPDGIKDGKHFEYKVANPSDPTRPSWNFKLETPLKEKDKHISKYYFISKDGTKMLGIWECEPEIVQQLMDERRQYTIDNNLLQKKYTISIKYIEEQLNARKIL